MPKVATLQESFSGGEFSPLVYGRVGAERYKTGLSICLNYIPTLQGPLIRRPGTKFGALVKDANKPPTLIPFQFSQSQNYILEFGDLYIRFYANNGQLLTTDNPTYLLSGHDKYSLFFQYYALSDSASPASGDIINTSSAITVGSTLELTSPYSYLDTPNIKYAQNADTLYLVHPKYPPYKLQRSAQTHWKLSQVQFRDGPYLPLNSYQTTGDKTGTPLNPLGVIITPIATASSSVTGLYQLATGPARAITGAANNGAGLIRLTVPTASGINNGDKIFVSGIAGTTEANNTNSSVWTALTVDATHIDLAGSTFANAYVGSGVVYPALFQPGSDAFNWADLGRNVGLVQGGNRYWGTIYSVIDQAHANFVIGYNSPVLANTSTIFAWQFGVFRGQVSSGSTMSQPAAICFHQDRLALAGATAYPQDVDLSMSGDYENFAASNSSLIVADNNALNFTLNSSEMNPIRWMTSNAQGLLAGAQNAEWQISPSSTSQALTPTNFNAAQTSFFGSAPNGNAVQAANATLFIQRSQRKVREMNYFFQVGTFRSTDLTELSEHVTLPQISKLAVQKETQPVVWAMRTDGNLASMTYNRDDLTLKVGWARHVLGGKSDASGTNPLIKSIAVIPDPTGTFDQLWLVVQRYINGAVACFIEYMGRIFDDSVLQEDSYHLDCGATYDAPITITVITNSNPAIVTAPAHGLVTGDSVQFTGVLGITLSTTDTNGNVTTTSLLNYKTFKVVVTNINTFTLTDYTGTAIDSSSYSAYVSGGQVRKLVTRITGLTWLKGETVSVLADGGIHPNVTVTQSSAITLNYPAAKVQIGYSYNSDGAILRTDAGAADGTSIGKTRRLTRAAFMLHNVGDFSFGVSFTNLIPAQFQQADQQYSDLATPLWSGIYRDGIESAYDFDGPLVFRQSTPLPGMVQTVTLLLEEFDV